MREISRCEEEIMIVIWSCEDAPDLQQVLNKVNEKFKHKWKPQTVSTFLSRLKTKGYLTAQRVGRYSYYYPEITLEQYREERIKETIELYYNGNAILLLEQIEDIRKKCN